jgi:hypothetical protein
MWPFTRGAFALYGESYRLHAYILDRIIITVGHETGPYSRVYVVMHADLSICDMNGGSRSSVRLGNYRFGGDVTQNDPASNQHDSNHAIAAPLLLWLSTMRHD